MPIFTKQIKDLPAWWTNIKTQAQIFSGALRFAFLAGSGERLVIVDTNNNVSADYAIANPYVDDTDIIAAITGATYNATNNFTSAITPANSKTMYRGYVYNAPGIKYEAIDDNVVARITRS